MRKIYIETYGCQMNLSDSEIVASVLSQEGFSTTEDIHQADIILLNTCSIRDHAEQRIKKRLQQLRAMKRKRRDLVIGLLGCMAGRIQSVLAEEEPLIELVSGPDSYRDLPQLIQQVESGQRAINTILSIEETYADITPVRIGSNGVSAFVSIMRGCENFCSYCVVPFVRGKERSRSADSIIREIEKLFTEGYREVVLLGQNVNSYRWPEDDTGLDFAGLLDQVARISPQLRIRFATSHPKDLSARLLETIALNPNICRAIHLPVQSGSNRILHRMNRQYTREDYMERIDAIRRLIPGCTISTDIITGFCDETEEDHALTLSLMKSAAFDYAFMFSYSERPQTLAAETLQDNVPSLIKERRLREVIDLQHQISQQSNRKDLGKIVEVLVEGESKRLATNFMGRTSGNKVVVFPRQHSHPGDYIRVKIIRCTSATLIGEICT